MKISKDLLKETRHIAIGEAVGVGLMFLVFALLKRWDLTVLWGGLLGGGYAVLNFLLMGINIQKALDDRERHKLIIQRSYSLRMLGMVAVIILGAALPCFQVFAVVIPMLLPRLTILVRQLRGDFKAETKGGE